jgi:D-3-phosphoglycerate dehydrogenase
MNVIGYDPYVTQEQVAPYIQITGREEVIRRADFLSMNMPLNDETRGAFGAREFSMMKKDAIIINAARGGLVQEDALIEALKSGTILGAGIDVFAQEPPAADNPLFTLENVIVTPHQAGSSEATLSRMSLHAAMGIDQVLNGKPVSWPLNHPI